LKTPACIIAGGETTVTVKGSGKGGRNQEMALSVADKLQDTAGWVFLSGGTDGVDGPTDAAGGVVDGMSVARAAEAGVGASECLQNNDAYRFLDASGDLIITGPTGTNVMDIAVLLLVDTN
jgi:glycerate-2-kinase